VLTPILSGTLLWSLNAGASSHFLTMKSPFPNAETFHQRKNILYIPQKFIYKNSNNLSSKYLLHRWGGKHQTLISPTAVLRADRKYAPFQSFRRLNECRLLIHAGSNRIYLRCHCSLKRIALEFGAMEYLIRRSDRRFGIARLRHSSGRSLDLIGWNCFAC